MTERQEPKVSGKPIPERLELRPACTPEEAVRREEDGLVRDRVQLRKRWPVPENSVSIGV